MAERECDGCEEETPFKHLGKIHGQYLCKKCRSEKRKQHRRETIETGDTKKDLNKLKYKIEKERGYAKKAYKKRREELGFTVRDKNYQPKIKGRKLTRVDKNNCYLTLEEKQNLYRILTGRGIDQNDAKERIRNLLQAQKEIREKMVGQKKSEEQIKEKQQEMLEELWEY